VIEGRSEIDQSLITGETLYVTAGQGTAVYAGSLNISGTLRVRVSAASEGTLLAEITRLLDNALQARSRYVRLADRASRLYAPVVHATALLTILGWVLMGASWHDAIVTGRRRSHHHLSLRAGSGDPDGADRRVGRDVQVRRPAQFR
jgi:Cu2+-exporting ATPase